MTLCIYYYGAACLLTLEGHGLAVAAFTTIVPEEYMINTEHRTILSLSFRQLQHEKDNISSLAVSHQESEVSQAPITRLLRHLEAVPSTCSNGNHPTKAASLREQLSTVVEPPAAAKAVQRCELGV